MINVFSVAVVCAIMAAVLLWTSCVRVTYASPGHGSVVFTVCFSMCGICFGGVPPSPTPFLTVIKRIKSLGVLCVMIYFRYWGFIICLSFIFRFSCLSLCG